ncbi:LOW QUALITY PROTEIN: auxin-responsive protein SAUR32-like [Herrania umbratica]|uniref:LOW QUALITY PROTEIN: auxin-responsive protein SAUR32-like n=1 Tax=Herrania umbratica TaxID=108875 RepID=A0A6J1A1Y3_9ROSI|nr:LOW QUALITY PROTEIN: auxin-responsive protein SAUR32-like [Herrania umbratica]
MGSGEKSLRNFHLHLPHLHHHHHHGKKAAKDVPKGCLAIKVGSQGEEQQRFVVPSYTLTPLSLQLLKEAEEEYGFDQKGTITIPCHVEEFRNVRGLIDREKSLDHHHHVGCFRV